jgi:uncharacterized protein (TIGR00725 family)
MPNVTRCPRIAVIGAGSCDDATAAAARLVGRAVAAAGAILFCGGLGGVMEAAAQGAADGGGRSVGLLPGRDAGEGNRFLSVAVATGMGEARNALVVLNADAVIAVDGGFGTLSEIALARKMGLPVVGLGTWRARDEAGRPIVVEVGDPEEAVATALRLAGRDAGP